MSVESFKINGQDTFLTGVKDEMIIISPPPDQAVSERLSIALMVDTVQDSNSIHSKLVDHALSQISCSLPSEVRRVTALQHQNNEQISTLQQELNQLQEEKRRVESRINELREEINQVRRQVYLLKESNAEINKRCIQHKKDIMGLVADTDNKRRLLSAQRLEQHLTKIRLMQYTQKLEDYSASLTTSNTTAVQAEIRCVEERIAVLKEKKQYMGDHVEEMDRVCSGTVEKDLKDKVDHLNKQSDQLSGEIQQHQNKVDSILEQQEQVRQATAVLCKRNAAQLLRLKQQVKEQQLRHHQWTEQKRLLEQNINSLKQKLQCDKSSGSAKSAIV